MSTGAAHESMIGQSIDAIDTPAMVVDLDAVEFNLKLMSDYFSDRHCRLRPHFKSHKCVELARRQLAAGNACGITCAKLSEAEQLAAGGVEDILIANQVVGLRKAARLANLNRSATVRCAVDSTEGIDQLGEQAKTCGSTIPVLVEVDIGMKRCGVGPGAPTLELARQVVNHKHLRFDGLQGYEGHLVCIVDQNERREKTVAAMQPLIETRRRIEQSGIEVPIVSGGSSSTFDVTGNIDGIDELQCGSYALMDWFYQELRPEFRIARWILASVMSAHSGSVVTDVGLKGIACDFGPPKVQGHPDAKVRYTAEEHIPLDNVTARIGDQVRFVPSHGCTTSSLHRRMWILRDDVIVDVWEIEGAGCLE
jgi:D-serine deaminase-like pyridoxal phosphate-dependent protein